MTIVLRADTLNTLLTYPDAVVAVADAFRLPDGEDAQASAERSIVRFPGGWLRILSGTLPQQDLVGFKAFHLTGDKRVHYLCALYRLSTGQPLALIDAKDLTVIRTAAAAAAAAAHHWGDRPIRVGVVGSGVQAREGLRALSSVCMVTAAKVYSRNPVNRAAYAEELTPLVATEITTVDSVRDAAAGVDLLLCGTHSDGSVAVRAEDIGDDVTYISSVGSTLPTQRELDHLLVGRARTVLVDTTDAVAESGDLVEASRAGLLDPARVTTMQTFLASPAPAGAGVTVYKSIGGVEQDLAIAGAALRKAEELNLGDTIAEIESTKVL